MRIIQKALGMGMTTVLCCSMIPAQQMAPMNGDPMPHMKTADPLPPPQHMTGIGNTSVTISTTNPEAKAWFDQGLNLLHDFWDFESSRAFEQSVKADPKCAMCWWGLYKAEMFRGETPDRAKQALAMAKKLSGHATEPEKLYIKAALQSDAEDKAKKSKHPEPEDAPHKDSKETRTLRKLVAISPQDTHAKILLAESPGTASRKTANPKPELPSGRRFCNGRLWSILTTPPRTTIGFTQWSPAIILSLRWKAPASSPTSRPPVGTWSTCRDTFSIAPATTNPRAFLSRTRCTSTKPTCATSTSVSTTTGTTSTT